jgi:hypothetical protein
MPSQVQFATQAVFEKLPLQPHPTAQLSGFLFLQLTVSELGICLPLHNITQVCMRCLYYVSGTTFPKSSCGDCYSISWVKYNLPFR